MPVGIEKVVLVIDGQEKSWKRFYLKADTKIQVKAIYHSETPENLLGSSKWIVKPRNEGPFTKQDQGGKIGDTRGIEIPAKYCGPKEFVIEAFMSRPENKFPTQLVFFGIAPEKIVSTKWSESKGGENIKNSKLNKYGDTVWLHMQTEGLNGSILEVDIFHRKGAGRDDTKVTTVRNVKCINGEVNLKIDNTYTWRAFTGLWTDNKEEFYIKVRLNGKDKFLKDKRGDDKHAVYLLFKDEISKREVGRHENAKPLTVGENEVNVERYEACRFTKIVVTEKEEKPITVFEEGKILLDKQNKKEFQASQTIYFDYNKWNVKNEAKKVLNGLIELLLDNPYVPAQLGAHCDSRGTNEYNDDLSNKRAKAVVDYLETKGISRKNLKWKGYGKRKPVIVGDNLTEDEHKENRRVTIKFLVTGGDAESIVYQTISGDKTRKLDVTIDITDYQTDQCLRKKDAKRKHEADKLKIVEYTSEGKNALPEKNGKKPVKHQVYSSLSKTSFVPFDYIFPHESKTNDFWFYINSCRYYSNKEKPAVIIKTYPDIKWDFHLYLNLSNSLSVASQSLGHARQAEMKKKAGKIGAEKRWKKTDIDFGVVLEAKWNKISKTNYETKEELTVKFESKIKKFYEIFAQLKDVSKIITGKTKGKAIKHVGKKLPLDVEMLPPNISLGAEWQLARGIKNHKETKELGTFLEFYLKAEPIVGLAITLDLLQFAITATGPAAPILSAIRFWLQDSETSNLTIDLYVNLVIFGEIKAGLKLKYNTASDKTDASQEISANAKATIGLKIEAGIVVKARMTVIVAEFYAEAYAKFEGKGSITFGHQLIAKYSGVSYRPHLMFDGIVAKVEIKATIGLEIKKGWLSGGNYDKELTDFEKEYNLVEPFDIIKFIEKKTGKSANMQII